MCLFTNAKVNGGVSPNIAQSNITVYKVFLRESNLGMMISPYQHKPYNKNKLYSGVTLRPDIPLDNMYGATSRLHQGYHAFMYPAAASYSANELNRCRFLTLTNFGRALRGDFVVCKVTIPKGSKYFLGYDDEIVSDTLFTDELTEVYHA